MSFEHRFTCGGIDDVESCVGSDFFTVDQEWDCLDGHCKNALAKTGFVLVIVRKRWGYLLGRGNCRESGGEISSGDPSDRANHDPLGTSAVTRINLISSSR